MRRRQRDQALATVVFTDIVGSTRIASELGDRRWRVLLTHHHGIVREELRRFGGREVDTAGDGFYAVFDEPSSALRCAAAISARVRELGIEIRAGANFGETEAIGGKPGGIAVHAASRIMAMAGPGEVLVSSTVRDLVPGSGFAFADRGTHELRDIPGTWRIFALTGVDGTPRKQPLQPEQAAALRDGIEPPPLLQRRSGRVGAAVLAIGLVAVVIAVPLATRKSAVGTPSPAPSSSRLGDRLVKVDATKKKVVAAYAMGEHPSAVAFGEGSVWVTSATTKTVARVDPVSGSVEHIPVGATADAIAVGAGAAWVGNSTAGTVSMIDAAANTVRTIDLGIGVGVHRVAVAVDDVTGSVWASFPVNAYDFNHVVEFDIGRIDPATSSFSTVARSSGGVFSSSLAAGGGSVWFASDGGRVVRLDARSGRVVWRHNLGGSFWTSAVGNGTAWLGSAFLRQFTLEEGTSAGTIMSIALATNATGDRVPIGGGPSGIAILGQGVYVSDLLGEVHPYVGGAVLKAIPVGGQATGIAAGEGFLWVSVNEP